MPSPIVSILIPCYNAEPYLAETIRSALAQGDEVPVEVILWDDGSTDRSLEIAHSFGESVRVLGGPNRGGNVARNRLLAEARGEWLQYLDADDVLLPGKIRGQMDAAARGGDDVAVVYSPPRCRDSDSGLERLTPHDPAADVWQHYLRWAVFQTSSLLMRRDAVEAVGRWREDQPCCQEHELLLRMLMAGYAFEFLPEPLTIYRVHAGGSVSRGNVARTTGVRMQLTDRAEQHLIAAGGLTAARRSALAAARLESARSLYLSDPHAARQLAGRVGRRGFLTAAPSDAAPMPYRCVAALAGFSAAERVAALRRGSSATTSGD